MRRRIVLVVVAGVGLAPATADAHLVTTGLGPFYDGVSHFLLSPESILGAVALALLAGLSGPAQGRTALFSGVGCCLLGAVVGYRTPFPIDLAMATAVPLVLGVLLAAGWSFPRWLLAVAAAAAGFVIGHVNGEGLAGGDLGATAVAGAVVTAFVVFAILAAVAVAAHARWARTTVRVAGSWIAAVSLLVIGWLWRTGGTTP
jgi:hydrogenase/urease accessory protein HupE